MSEPNRSLLITGASGFIGRHVMATAGAEAIAVSLRAGDTMVERLVGSLAGRQARAVIHLGGRAHQADANDPGAVALYRRDNCDLAVELAEAALAIGIPRFVFVSSIAVFGRTSGTSAFGIENHPNPDSIYAKAKWEAEQALAEVATRGLELVVVRPPLVYGAGAAGNLARLARVIGAGVPLPLASVKNRRSIVNVRDLADLLLLAAQHPMAPGAVLLPADRAPVSTPDLVRSIGEALGRPARLLPLPVALLRLAGRLTGQARTVSQLVDSLELDPASTTERLGWTPQRGLEEGLAAMVAASRSAA